MKRLGASVKYYDEYNLKRNDRALAHKAHDSFNLKH